MKTLPPIHVTTLDRALTLCAAARMLGEPNPTFTVSDEDFPVFEKYMGRSYTVMWEMGGKRIPVHGIMPLFEKVAQ